jgi:hypothetical protein
MLRRQRDPAQNGGPSKSLFMKGYLGQLCFAAWQVDSTSGNIPLHVHGIRNTFLHGEYIW